MRNFLLVSCIKTELSNTIQQKIQEHSKSGRSLEPVEEADMAVKVTCAEGLHKLCLNQANITTDDQEDDTAQPSQVYSQSDSSSRGGQALCRNTHN